MGCDDGGHGGQSDQRQQCPVRSHQIERVLDGLRVVQQKRTLAKIVQGQCGHDHTEPGNTDGLLAEVAHVGIQRFAARHTQHHGAQNDESGSRVVPNEVQGIKGTDGPQNAWLIDDMAHTQHGDRNKPNHRDRSEKLANPCRAALLHRKQAEQDDQSERNHEALEARRNHFQTFDRGQHRDSRGNDSIPIKQAGAEDADEEQSPAQAGLVFDRLRRQSQHGHQSAFTVVVGAQHQHHVFDRDDDRQGPEEDREDAVNIGFRKRHMTGAEDLFQCVQHAGADVAVYNADGTERKCRERRFGCRHKNTRPAMDAGFRSLRDRYFAPRKDGCKGLIL